MAIQNKPLINAIANGDVKKVEKLLKKKVTLLNTIIRVDKLNFTPLGYAIYYGKNEIVSLLLGFDDIELTAGYALFSEAEVFAKAYGKHEIASLIARHKAQKVVMQHEDREQEDREQEDREQEENKPEDIYETQILLHLKAGNFDEIEKIVATAKMQEFSGRAENVEIIAKLINFLFMRSVLSRWIITPETKGQETKYENRDDALSEDAEAVSRHKELRNRELKLIREVIGCLCPKLKDANNETLRKYIKDYQLKTKRTDGDESDDSDSEDDLSFNNEDTRSNTKTTQHKKIKELISLAEMWLTTKRERQGGGLVEKLRKVTISKENIDKIRLGVFNTKRDREKLEPPSITNQKRFVAQFRGINYMPDRWNLSSRRYHYRMDEVGHPQFSESILKTLPFNFYTQLCKDNDYCKDNEVNERLAVVAQNLKESFFALESEQNPIIERTVIGSRDLYFFNNIPEWMQHGFANGISQHLLDLKENRERHKHGLHDHTLNSFNYAVSTSDCPNHALRYALGLKTYYADNFEVNYNQNGSILNSHVGKIYVVLQEADEFNRPGYIRHVLRLAHEGKVPINKTGGVDIASELENDYIGYISGDKVVVELRLKFPSFHKTYKPIYEIKYGLNKELYNLFGGLIKKTWQQDDKGPDNKAHQAAILLLKEWLCSYYEVLLLKMAQDKANDMGGSLVYIHHDGSQQQEPDHVPFVNGDAHMPNRNRTRVLQNFRIIAGMHFSEQQHANLDEMIKLAIEEHLTKLVDGVVYEPTVPEGLVKMADNNTRVYYLRINGSDATDLEKKREIAQDILFKHKSTFKSPLLFSDKARIDELRNKRVKQELTTDQETVYNLQRLSI